MEISKAFSDVLAIGIEIGGTKLQVGVGSASGKLLKPPIPKQVIREDVVVIGALCL